MKESVLTMPPLLAELRVCQTGRHNGNMAEICDDRLLRQLPDIFNARTRPVQDYVMQQGHQQDNNTIAVVHLNRKEPLETIETPASSNNSSDWETISR